MEIKLYNDGNFPIAIKVEEKKGETLPRSKKEPEKAIVIVEHAEAKNDLSEDENGVTEQKESVTRVTTLSAEFERWFRESGDIKKWKSRYRFIAEKMAGLFESKKELREFLNKKMNDAYRAMAVRRTKWHRRAYLHQLDTFCTFTYDSAKMDEEKFKKKLLNTLRHFSSRRGWKYMGTWERGGKNGRLHFHALIRIPEGEMVGEVVNVTDYDPIRKKIISIHSNTFFMETFGRNTFEKIPCNSPLFAASVQYILKYLEKGGGRMTASRGLKTFVKMEVSEEDIITPLHDYDDRKYIMFQDFKVYTNGECLGQYNVDMLDKLELTD